MSTSAKSASTLTDVAAAYVVSRRLKRQSAYPIFNAAESFESIMGPLPVCEIDADKIREWKSKAAKLPSGRTGKRFANQTIGSRLAALETLLRSAPGLAAPKHPISPDTLSGFARERAPHSLTLTTHFDGWAGSPSLAEITAGVVNEWLDQIADETGSDRRLLHHAARAMERLLVLAADEGRCQPPEPNEIGSIHEWQDPQAKLIERIGKAAAMHAIGKSYSEIAAALGVSAHTVGNWAYKPETKPFWDAALARVMRKTAAVIRQQAGTDAVLEDVDRYLAMAIPCERWHNDQGESLFPDGDKMTLPRFYYEYYRPARLGDASKDTLKWHEILLRRWVVLTGNPELKEITTTILARFRDCLLASKGRGVNRMSPNTVVHYMAFIQALLDKAGPPGHRNRDALGLIDRPPWVKPPRKLRRIPRIATAEELSALYEAAACMEMPHVSGAKPPEWWKALLVTAFNTGLRKGTLFKLRMSWIDWQRRAITIPAEATKTFVAQIIPLNETCYSHLLRIRGDRDLLFEWPYTAKRTFYWNLDKLFELAGIPKDRRFGLHAIRKATATALWEHSPAAAQYTLGHTTPETTRLFYVSGGGIVARALEAMPQPQAFVNGLKNDQDKKGGAA